MSDRLNVALIGCGGIAGMKHVPAVRANADLARIAAVQDVDVRRARNLAQECGSDVRVYETVEELLSDRSIDVVHVCTPNATHAPVSIAAMCAGKHVLCEKPIADTQEAAREMIRVQRETGKLLSISYQNRFRHDSQAIKRACESGSLGEIYYAKAHATRRRRAPNWGSFLSAGKSGGPMLDIGVHAIDLALWFMDNYDVESVSGSVFHKLADCPEGNVFGPWDPEQFNVEDSAVGFVRMRNGATLLVEASYALNLRDAREAMTTLCGTRGGAEQIVGDFGYGSFDYIINTVANGDLVTVRPDLSHRFLLDDSQARNELMGSAPAREFRCWFEAVLNHGQPPVLPEQAYIVNRVAEAILESGRTGRTIHFESDEIWEGRDRK